MPSSPLASMPTQSQLQLLGDIAALLRLPAADAGRLASPNFFTGPTGLVCRLWLKQDADAVRPEVLLPLRAREFRDENLERGDRHIPLARDGAQNKAVLEYAARRSTTTSRDEDPG